MRNNFLNYAVFAFLFGAATAFALYSPENGSEKEKRPPLPKEMKGQFYYDSRNKIYYQEIESVNLSTYNGKTIQSMTYCDGCGPSGDYLILKFTDNTQVKVYAYKYDMKVYY